MEGHLREKDIPFPEIRMQIGKGGDQLIPVFLSRSELQEYGEQIAQRRGEIFKKEYLSEVKGFPGVRKLFQRSVSRSQENSPRLIRDWRGARDL